MVNNELNIESVVTGSLWVNANGVTTSINHVTQGSTHGIKLSNNATPTVSTSLQPGLVAVVDGTISAEIKADYISIAQTFFGSSVGLGLINNVPQVNIGSNFALSAGSVSKKVVASNAQFVNGQAVVATGLSLVDSATATPISGGPTTDIIGTSILGGSVTFYCSNTTSSAFFSYNIVGTV